MSNSEERSSAVDRYAVDQYDVEDLSLEVTVSY